jgi:hypothetical protein
MAAIAAMILHARKRGLSRTLAGHLVGNALGAHVVEVQGVDLGDLPSALEALRGRVALDRDFLARFPGYDVAGYPEDIDEILVELAAVWSAYEQGHVPEDPLRSLLRAHDADPTLAFKVRLRNRRWHVTAKRRHASGSWETIARDDHHLAEVAIGEVLRCVPTPDESDDETGGAAE